MLNLILAMACRLHSVKYISLFVVRSHTLRGRNWVLKPPAEVELVELHFCQYWLWSQTAQKVRVEFSSV